MVRPYCEADSDELWELKQEFETALGTGTGGDEKQVSYENKLSAGYRGNWLEWVKRCTDENEHCVQVVEHGDECVGYVFVLPESLAFIWDAAVLNEIFVQQDHRGTGVANELMESAIAVARDQNLPLERMVLDVDRKNERAQAFYERFDFTHWGEMVAREI